MNAKDIYIQVIFKNSKKLTAKVDVLKFKNKKLINTLKIEK